MKKRILTTALEVIGASLITGAFILLNLVAGLTVAGIWVLVFAYFIERSE